MADAVTEQTREVLARHFQAVDSGSLDAILADYAEGAVLLTPEGPRRGRGEIRAAFAELLRDLFTPDLEFALLREDVEGEVAYIVWRAESKRYRVPLATDTFVIRGGKIAVQTFAGRFEEKSGAAEERG